MKPKRKPRTWGDVEFCVECWPKHEKDHDEGRI
jgi:hypothetical protein